MNPANFAANGAISAAAACVILNYLIEYKPN
jgi:hypothetical protein